MNRKKEKYKKRCQRLRQKMTSEKSKSPRSKTQMDAEKYKFPKHVTKTLFFHNTLMHQIKEKYKSASYKDKHSFRRSLTTGLLKKYKLVSTMRKCVTDQEVKGEDNVQEANKQLKAELLEALDSTVTEQVNSMFKELLDTMSDSESSWTAAIMKLECKVDKLKKLDERLPGMYERLSVLEKANKDKSELKKICERLSALEKANNDKSELHKLKERLSALEKATNDMSELKVDMNYGVI